MNATATIELIKQFCKENSGDTQVWTGNKGTYQWNLGKETDQGVVNGVVRKLAGIDSGTGQQIWVVAGSLKIMPDGSIARFTGLPKKLQTKFMVEETATVTEQETVNV